MFYFCVFILILAYVRTSNATFVEVCAMNETPITCYNNTKIFIQSALYGRSNNFTCLSGQEVSSCNTLVDVSWRVLPDCQGKSSCVVSGSFDGLGSPCISSYFNISYDCKTLNEGEFADNTTGNLTCPKGQVIVLHYLEWRGIEFILKNRTVSSNSSSFIHSTTTSVTSMATSFPHSSVTSQGMLPHGSLGISATNSNIIRNTATILAIHLSSEQIVSTNLLQSSFLSSQSQVPTSSSLSTSSSSSSSSSLSSSFSSSSPLSSSSSSSPSSSSSSLSPSSSLSSSPSSLSSSPSSSLPPSAVSHSSPQFLSSVSQILSSSTLWLSSVNYEFYNVKEVLTPVRVHHTKLMKCMGTRKCSFDVSTNKFGDPYPGKITLLRIFIRHSCQLELGGFLQWGSWSSCPDVCGIRYHQTRRRVCANPPTPSGGADCFAPTSETQKNPCYKPCLERNSTTCELMKANLSCPNETFININSIFYGRDQDIYNNCSNDSPLNGSCIPSNDMAGHNSAQVYERCQMRGDCTVMVSNDTFRDPCPGVKKVLKIQYSCSPIFTRTFCDDDIALMSCPSDQQLVLHERAFYGRMNASEFCPTTNNITCTSDVSFYELDGFCSGTTCTISPVSYSTLEKKECKYSSNYLTISQSCQGRESIYTAWGEWSECEACGLTSRRRRCRDCISPGITYDTPNACSSSNKRQEEECYIPCAEHNLTLRDGENSTIDCPKYNGFHTVIEIRSVIYGNVSCLSKNQSKVEVMKRCQGRNTCLLEASEEAFNDSCPGIEKFLNVTYKCQSIYKMEVTEGYGLTPRNLRCYDNMVIVTHFVSWSKSDCETQPESMHAIQSRCDGEDYCYVRYTRSVLGDPCPDLFLMRFVMYYSCQTANGGLDSEWSAWSNCSGCGHAPIKRRVKTCLSPVSKTSGAHCPLIQQIAACYFPCPVQELSMMINNSFVVLGQILTIDWELEFGTNATAVIDWGDNSGNETLSRYILANATTPFLQSNKHNYSAEGDYEVRLDVFNFFSNQTISKMVYVQVLLSGLNFTVPSVVATNTSFQVNVSLDVVSLSPPNVTIKFGDGSAVTSTRFKANHSYSQAGVFAVNVIVVNKVNILSSVCWITVQDPIKNFMVDSDVFKFPLGNDARFLLSITGGSNVSVNTSFDECGLPFLITSLHGPDQLTNYLTSAFHAVGTCTAKFYAANAVSRANTSALVISEIAIDGFNVTVECLSQYPSCFQKDLVLFQLNVTNGTHPKFWLDMADGTIITSSNKSLVYSYTSHGTFHINITAYNNVSSISLRREINVEELVPVQGAYLDCNKTVRLSDLTVCNLGLAQGTAFGCLLSMGDGGDDDKYFTYVNLSSSVVHNYTSYGEYTVRFACNNKISENSVEFITKKSRQSLEIDISHNGPVTANNVLTLTLRASETRVSSCFVLDLGNDDGVLFGSSNCSLANTTGFEQISSFVYPLVYYNYTYTVAGTYNISWIGQSGIENASVHTIVRITELPCSTPKVSLPNIADNPLQATGIFRSVQFIIRSRYEIDCEGATGAVLQWEIFRNETDKGLVLHARNETKTSSLIIQPNVLDYGTYCIKLKFLLTNAYGLFGAAEGYLKIVTSDLIIDMQEGSANMRMFSQPITINATGSKDPDTTDQSGLEFSWYCYNMSDRWLEFNDTEYPLSTLQSVLKQENTLPNGCFSEDGNLTMNGSFIDLPRQNMLQNGVYLVMLVLKTGNREARKGTVVQISHGQISHFHIRCEINCEYLAITTDVLSVSSHCISGPCKNTTSESYSWQLFYRKANITDNLNWTKVGDLEALTLSNKSARSLVVKANALKPEMTYVIQMRHGSDDFEGLSEYSFTTSRPPWGGNCSVLPSEGTAYDTTFTFRCAGWKADHQPLHYVFAYHDPFTLLRPIIFQAEEEEFSVRLAPGEQKENFHLQVFFSVIDSLGARTENQTQIKVLPRNLTQSELEGLFLNDNSKIDFLLNIGDINAVSELVSGVLSSLNQKVEQYGGNLTGQESEFQSLVRYTVIDKVSKIPISTLSDFNQVATMIAAAGEVKQQVNSTAQEIATDKLENMADFLLGKSKEDISWTDLKEGVVNSITAISNIMDSASYNADFSRNDLTQEADRNKSIQVSKRNVELLDKVAEAVSTKLLPDQADVEIITKSARLSCRRASGQKAFSDPIVAGDASVQFPENENSFGDGEKVIQVWVLLTNPFSYDVSSQEVTTPIVDIKVINVEGDREVLNVTNLSKDIVIQIPLDDQQSVSPRNVFFKQSDNSSIQYHTTEVQKVGVAIEFLIEPLEDQAEMTVFIKFGMRPTIHDWDLRAKLPNYSSCSFANESSHDLHEGSCLDSPYSIFLPSTYLTRLGTYHIGVKFDAIPGNSSEAQSRKKRDCGGGGRSKRSCIQYKDPPPTLPSNGKFATVNQGYDKSKHSNYSMEQLGLGCNFWNPTSNQFSGAGCRTGRKRTMSRTLSCRCKHLTSFGGGLLVKPNPIDFGTVWVAFADIHNNIAVLATIIAIFLLYLIVIVWARRADLRDRNSQEGVIVVGTSWTPFSYEIKISTAKATNSGTTANVTMIITGENGSSGILQLSKLTEVKFNRGSVINCTLHLPNWLGQLLYIHVWHDNTGDSPSWKLDHVVIRDTKIDEKWSFMCGDWLAVETEEGRTDKVMYIAGIDEITNYKNLFLSNSADGLCDEHLWFSVAAKPPQSSFSRVQRLSCCLSVLFCTMIANAMFYDGGRADTSPVFYLGPLKISVRQLIIGIQSSLIIFPVNLAMTQLFRKTSSWKSTAVPDSAAEEKQPNRTPTKAKPNGFIQRFTRRNSSLKYRTMDSDPSTESLSTILSSQNSERNSPKERLTTTKSILDIKNEVISNPKSNPKTCLYRFLYYMAWLLCFVSVFVSAFFTLLYSLQWGKEKSEQWLLSFFVSFFQDAVISQPAKVAMLSAIVALFVKWSMKQKEKRRRPFPPQTKDLHEKETSFSTSPVDENNTCSEESQPLQEKDLKKAKLKRMKELKSSQVMMDVFLYTLFLFLLLMVAYGHRDPIAYEMTNHLENQFSLSASKYIDVWGWALTSLLPIIFVRPWYNGQAPSASEDGLMSDRCSALVGMTRIRQLRIKEDSCGYDIPTVKKFLLNDCYGLYSMEDEDMAIYQPDWIPVPPNTPAENITHELCPRPWRYHSASDLKGVPMWGKTTMYSGGGYVAELGYYISKAQEVILELAQHKWLDRRSRGIFVELTVYNAQVNLFSVITLLAEGMPTGGVVTFRRIDTIRVYRYLGELGNVTLAAELIICLVIIFFLYKVIKRLYHQRLSYFTKFWNLVDLFQVLFALVSVALYFVKMVSINETMKDLSENPFVFVSFSRLLTWSEIDTYMIAFVVFLTTIKFLYLLRYNNHIKLLSRTFSNMRKEIILFTVQFMLWFLPFVLMAHIWFSAHLEDFISLPSSFQAMLNAILGASYFHDLEQVNRVLGPALFLTYSVLMELILLNMFVSIINVAFEDRESTMIDSETDPELVEFLMKKFKDLFGFNLLANTIGPQEKWTVDDSSDEDNLFRAEYKKNGLDNTFRELNKKLTSLRDRFRTFSLTEAEEDILLEIIIKREHDSLRSLSCEDSGTSESSTSSPK